MDPVQDVIAELREVTRKLAVAVQLDTGEFTQLLMRRGELIRCLCSGAFDPSDARITAILRDGEHILDRARTRRELLKSEASSLELLGSFCGGIRSTIPRKEHAAVDVTA